MKVGSTMGIEVAPNPGCDPDDAGLHLRGRILIGKYAHGADAGGAVGVFVGMATDDVISPGTPLEDVAHEIDEIVVADVAPTTGNRVVVVDGPDGNERILEVG